MNLVINVLVLIPIFLLMGVIAIRERGFSRRKTVLVGKGVLLVMILAFANRELGLDMFFYREMYASQPAFSLESFLAASLLKQDIEPFFVLLMSILNSNGFSFKVFLFVTVAIPFCLIWIVCKNTSRAPLLAFTSFFLIFTFKFSDAIRAGFAASLFLYGLYLLSERKNFKSVVLLFISIFVHYSNLITLVAIPFIKINWTLRKFSLGLILTVVASAVAKLFLHVDLQGSDYAILWKFDYYMNSNKIEFVNLAHMIMWYLMGYFYYLATIIIILYFLINKNSLSISYFEKNIIGSSIVGVFLGVFFSLLGAEIVGLRLHFLFSIGVFLLIPQFVSRNVNEMSFINSYVLFYCVTVIYIAVCIVYNAGVFLPESPLYLGI